MEFRGPFFSVLLVVGRHNSGNTVHILNIVVVLLYASYVILK